MNGELIDHYHVLERIGRGAMGVVYKALDVNLDRQVAIKVMSVEARSDPDFVERFRQEARLQGALNHPNVALLFDYFIHNGAPVAVMEFIDGESLEQLIRRRGPVPAHESIPLFRQALRGVAAAHRAGIIHRDLKTSNLMITRDGIVKVMDFGIAKRQGSTGATKASTSIGSPLYMAPEQILGRPVDCRTDVYALGITLYQLLSGQPPFNPRGKTEYSVLNAHVNDLPVPPTVHCRNIPQPLVDAVMRALAKDPAARFQSADEFMQALPDVPAPAAAAPNGTLAINAAAPRVGPTGTVAIPRADPRDTMRILSVSPGSTVAIPRVDPSSTVALEYSPSMSEEPVATHEPGGTGLEPVASTRRDPHDTMAFDYFAATLRRESDGSAPEPAAPPSHPAPSPAAQRAPAARPGRMRLLRTRRLGLAAALLAALGLGALIRHAQLRHATLPSAALTSSGSPFTRAQASAATRMSAFTEPAAPSPAVPRSTAEAPAVPPAEGTAATAASATAAPLTAASPVGTTAPVATAPPTRRDLSGTWRGEYVDASGRPLLRVMSLSISRVYDDGGIEGTLQYQAASGAGVCQLHPRGSSYSAGEQRLQLSPESCSPHYPRELGVPLDFDGVTPRANTLKNGRIEAPTGEVIKVRLKRVSGL